MNIEIQKIQNGYLVKYWFSSCDSSWYYVKTLEEINKYINDAISFHLKDH